MHEFFMEKYGNYLKDNYCCLDKMSVSDLCEAKEIAKTMYEIFKADKEYNIVKAMEEGDNSDIEMKWDEFVSRLQDFYDNADTATKVQMKSTITKIMS